MRRFALAGSWSSPFSTIRAALAAQLRALYRLALALSSARPLWTPRAVRAGGFQSSFLSDQLALRHPRFPGMPNVKFSGPPGPHHQVIHARGARAGPLQRVLGVASKQSLGDLLDSIDQLFDLFVRWIAVLVVVTEVTKISKSLDVTPCRHVNNPG